MCGGSCVCLWCLLHTYARFESVAHIGDGIDSHTGGCHLCMTRLALLCACWSTVCTQEWLFTATEQIWLRGRAQQGNLLPARLVCGKHHLVVARVFPPILAQP